MTTTADQLALYAAAEFAAGDIAEVRRLRGGRGRSSWHYARELPDLAEALLRDNAAGWQLYVGANPRRGFGLRGNVNVAYARCLFAEFDDIGTADAQARIDSVGMPPPTMMLWSGHGPHVYWRLAGALFDLELWRAIQKDLIACLRSDPIIHNPERLMRLGGFTNWKPPTARAEILACDPARQYPLADLRAILDYFKPPATTPAKPSPANSPPMPGLGEGGEYWLAKAIERARGGHRNNNGLWLACQLRDDGLSASSAEPIMLRYVAEIGAGGGHRYTEREALATLRQAYGRAARERARSMRTRAYTFKPLRLAAEAANG